MEQCRAYRSAGQLGIGLVNKGDTYTHTGDGDSSQREDKGRLGHICRETSVIEIHAEPEKDEADCNGDNGDADPLAYVLIRILCTHVHAEHDNVNEQEDRATNDQSRRTIVTEPTLSGIQCR